MRVCFVCDSDVSRSAEKLYKVESSKMLLIFRLSKAGSVLSPKDGEHICPSYRGRACPYGPAAERVCGSRGSQGDLYGLYLSIYLSI